MKICKFFTKEELIEEYKKTGSWEIAYSNLNGRKLKEMGINTFDPTKMEPTKFNTNNDSCLREQALEIILSAYENDLK